MDQKKMDVEQQAGYETDDEDEKKYTPGKLLRKMKQLRKEEKHEMYELGKEQREYVEWFKSQGGVFENLGFAKFYLKNGLCYPGLVAQERIQCNQDMIRAPVKLLLTTRDAIEISELFEIYQKFPKFFHGDFQSQWEDHVQAVFLLYEYQKGPSSKWWPVVNNLPKDQDYIIFWPEEELQSLEDSSFIDLIRKSRMEVEEKYKVLSHILDQYPQLFAKQSYSWQNFKWVYSHLVTRCFGKYLCYVTMVPLAEYLNHECIDVYYDFDYKQENPAKPESNYDTDSKVLTEKEMEEMTSSDESYGSEDSETDNEIEYEEEFASSYSNQAKVNENIKKLEISLKDTIDPETKLTLEDKNQDYENQCMIKNYINNMHLWIYGNLDFGDNYQIFYAGLIYKELEKLQEKFLFKEISYQAAKNQINYLKQLNETFLFEIIKLIKLTINPDIKNQQLAQVQKRPNPETNQENRKEKNIEELISQFDLDGKQEQGALKSKFEPIENWETDKFDYFVMRTSRKDQFEKGSQVYFCYGRLSNRLLLMRYGITLEWNKYNHYHLRIPYFPILNNQDRFSLTALNHVKTVFISKYKRFKLKLVKFNFEILIFMKLAHLFQIGKNQIADIFYIKNFSLELEALKILKKYYEDQQASFKFSIEENEKMLYDPAISYSQYFIIIYRLDKQRIIQNQLKLTQVLIEIFNRAVSDPKLTFKNQITARVTELETYEEYRRNRILLKPYFATLHPSIQK